MDTSFINMTSCLTLSELSFENILHLSPLVHNWVRICPLYLYCVKKTPDIAVSRDVSLMTGKSMFIQIMACVILKTPARFRFFGVSLRILWSRGSIKLMFAVNRHQLMR